MYTIMVNNFGVINYGKSKITLLKVNLNVRDVVNSGHQLKC